MRIYKFSTGLLLCSILATPVHADQLASYSAPSSAPGSTPSAVGTAAALTMPPGVPIADPKPIVAKLAATLGAAPGLTYVDQLTVKTSTGGTPVSRSLIINAELSKPNSYVYNMGASGTLISDGSSTLAVDGEKQHYNLYPVSDTSKWGFVSTRVLRGQAPLLTNSLVGYVYSHITQKDFTNPTLMQLTGTQVVQNSKKVDDIEYKNAQSEVHLLVDPKSNMLVGIHYVLSEPDGSTVDTVEQLSNLKIAAVAAPLSDFSTAPPPGATVLNPAPVPVAKPQTQTPARRSGRRRAQPYIPVYNF